MATIFPVCCHLSRRMVGLVVVGMVVGRMDCHQAPVMEFGILQGYRMDSPGAPR